MTETHEKIETSFSSFKLKFFFLMTLINNDFTVLYKVLINCPTPTTILVKFCKPQKPSIHSDYETPYLFSFILTQQTKAPFHYLLKFLNFLMLLSSVTLMLL